MDVAITKKRKSLLLVILVIIISFLFSVTVMADNHDVMDKANVLNQSTEDYIYNINEYQLSKIQGHPQIAVYTTNDVDGDLDGYAQKLFEKYQFGTRGYDNGILLLIDVGDHKIRMQTGYGVEAAVPDDYVNTLMDSKVQNLFRDNNYSTGTKIMVNRLTSRLYKNRDQLRSKSYINNHKAEIEAEEQRETSSGNQRFSTMMWIILCVGFFMLAPILSYKIVMSHQRKKAIERELTKVFKIVINDVNQALDHQGLVDYKLDLDAVSQKYYSRFQEKAEIDCASNKYDFQVTDYVDKTLEPVIYILANYLVVKRMDSRIDRMVVESNDAMEKPLADYKRFVKRYETFEKALKYLRRKVRRLDNKDYDYYKDCRQYVLVLDQKYYPHLVESDKFEQSVRDAINDVSATSFGTFEENIMNYLKLDDYKNQLFDKILNDKMPEDLKQDLMKHFLINDIDTISDRLKSMDQGEAYLEISNKFNQRIRESGIYEKLWPAQKKELKNLDIETKKEALNAPDNALLYTYLLVALSSTSGAITNDVATWDDVNSYGGFGSSDSGSDFGGDGGFSGGGGGDASW